MKKYFLFLLILISCLYAQDNRQVVILHTTDLHGSIYPYNYFTDTESNSGLAKVYTKVKEFRQKYKNVFLLDSGDLLQGTPLIYYFNHVNNSMPNPMILTMNFMKYDAFTVGNHDIEQGFITYYKAERESDFPWLSANGVMAGGSTYFKPFTIIERNGIKIGIIGLTTPAIPMWLDKSLYPGIEWKDMVTTAKIYVKELHPRVDIMIGLFHAGMNAEYGKQFTDAKGLPIENASKLIAEEIAEFDFIFCGHSHRIFPAENENPLINNTVMVMSGSYGSYLGIGKADIDDTNKIINKTGYVLPLNNVSSAQEILDIARPFHVQTLNYIRQEIGSLSDSISGKDSRLKDTPLVELINNAQLFVTGADISFAASFNDKIIIPPGPILVKDVYGMYKYENFLYLIEMSGKQIIDYLEFSANYFLYDKKSNKISANPKMAGYNFDMAEGISYLIDVNAKIGKRIKEVIFQKTGKKLDLRKTYKVALNSYRASGGGGHLSAAGINNPNILWQSNEEIRNILIEYIRDKKDITVKVDENWKIVLAEER